MWRLEGSEDGSDLHNLNQQAALADVVYLKVACVPCDTCTMGKRCRIFG